MFSYNFTFWLKIHNSVVELKTRDIMTASNWMCIGHTKVQGDANPLIMQRMFRHVLI